MADLVAEPRSVTFALVAPGDPSRGPAEAVVRSVYARRYGAVIRGFPETLAALLDRDGRPVCVAGVRFGLDECFSEQYLDLPIEFAVAARTGMPVDRRQMLEVTTLASLQSTSPFRLINEVIREGRDLGMRWGIFTATRRLRQALRRTPLDLLEIAPACRDRIVAADDWGRYYGSDPWVCAVSDPPRAVAARAASPAEILAENLAQTAVAANV
jgi:hypothetical protein